MSRKDKKYRLLQAFLAFIVIGIFSTLCIKQGLTAYSLGKKIEKNGVSTTGKVIAFDVNNDTDGGKHYRPIVQFQDLAGHTHTITNKFEVRNFEKVYIGSDVTVSFLADTPSIATTDTPSLILGNAVFYLVMGATFIIIGVVAAYTVYHRV